MTASLSQLQFEIQAWKRILDFMSDENIRLKDRVSEMLQVGIDPETMDEMDNFQNQFVVQDALVNVLRHDLAEFERYLPDGIVSRSGALQNLGGAVKRTRQDIIIAERDFRDLQARFNDYFRNHG